jgi:L-amino acid N-acyltransferase
MKTRAATESDLPGILEIYNDAIRTGTAVYDDQPHTLEMRREWLRGKTESGMPVLVIDDGGEVAGFGTYGLFRNFTGYRFCVEHSVYVSEKRRARGYGRFLISTLMEMAARQGMHSMIAGVDAQNEVSIRLHLALGFVQVAHIKEVGYKFDRWLDLVLMQKFLPAAN